MGRGPWRQGILQEALIRVREGEARTVGGAGETGAGSQGFEEMEKDHFPSHILENRELTV